MAIDTRGKRASALGFGLLALVSPPAPDGTIGTADRAHVSAMYAGITVAAPVDLPDTIELANLSVTIAGLSEVVVTVPTLASLQVVRAGLSNVTVQPD